MNKSKKQKVLEAGYRITDTKTFLGLSDSEAALIESWEKHAMHHARIPSADEYLYAVTLAEDLSYYTATALEFPSLEVQNISTQEALKDIRALTDALIRTLADKGEPIPAPLPCYVQHRFCMACDSRLVITPCGTNRLQPLQESDFGDKHYPRACVFRCRDCFASYQSDMMSMVYRVDPTEGFVAPCYPIAINGRKVKRPDNPEFFFTFHESLEDRLKQYPYFNCCAEADATIR